MSKTRTTFRCGMACVFPPGRTDPALFWGGYSSMWMFEQAIMNHFHDVTRNWDQPVLMAALLL